MMRILVLAAAILAGAPAFAAEPQADPVQAATGQTLTEMVAELVHWRAVAIAEEREIATLRRRVAADEAAP